MWGVAFLDFNTMPGLILGVNEEILVEDRSHTRNLSRNRGQHQLLFKIMFPVILHASLDARSHLLQLNDDFSRARTRLTITS